MRSKEVDKSIKSLENFVNQKYYNGVTAEEMKTVLEYIEELEQENKFLRDENNIYRNETVGKKRIRDKIKELVKKLDEPNDDRWEKDDDVYYGKIKAQIQVLKSIIGE